MANSARQLAAADAQASVPTLGSIQKQYGQSKQNVRGFTTALIGLLNGVNPAAGYNSAVGSQEGIDNAASARLAALGSPYAAGSAAATQGLGDSSISNLLANQGSAAAFGAKQPGIAAARGQLGVTTLNQQQQQAIQARNQAYGANFQTALQAARAFGLQKQSFQEGRREFNVQSAQAAANATQSANQFAASQSQQFREFLIHERDSIAAASGGSAAPGSPLAGFTPNEIASLENRASKAANGLILQANPTSPVNMINALVAQGIPRPIAFMETNRAYQENLATTPSTAAGRQAFNIARRKYVAWVRQRKFNRVYGAAKGAPPKAPPGHPE